MAVLAVFTFKVFLICRRPGGEVLPDDVGDVRGDEDFLILIG